jgi:hypothetical protein
MTGPKGTIFRRYSLLSMERTITYHDHFTLSFLALHASNANP